MSYDDIPELHFGNLTFTDSYAAIPEHMQEAVLAYVRTGRLTGDFLRAVVENNLVGAVGHADERNLPLIPLYVRWFYNRAPMLCCGSRRAVVDWIAHGGLDGNHTRIGGREGDITTT